MTEDDCDCSDTNDIDLHRYRCLDCGKIGYYSNMAKKAYENNDKESKDFLGI